MSHSPVSGTPFGGAYAFGVDPGVGVDAIASNHDFVPSGWGLLEASPNTGSEIGLKPVSASRSVTNISPRRNDEPFRYCAQATGVNSFGGEIAPGETGIPLPPP